MTGLPCGPKAEISRKGYFSKEGIRHGRQLGRVVAGATEEVVVDLLFAGNVQLNSALRALAYAKLYDQRAGAIEVESKQGVGLNRRRKKRAAARAMLTLLGTLAHNVLVWAREWLKQASRG